jgi:hypothetical protein
LRHQEGPHESRRPPGAGGQTGTARSAATGCCFRPVGRTLWWGALSHLAMAKSEDCGFLNASGLNERKLTTASASLAMRMKKRTQERGYRSRPPRLFHSAETSCAHSFWRRRRSSFARQ